LNDSKTLSLDQFKEKIKQIITKEVPLRDPAIAVVHIPKESYSLCLQNLILNLKQLRENFSEWTYKLFNSEEILFSLLGKGGYTEDENFALKCQRNLLKKDLETNIRKSFLSAVENEISDVKSLINADSSIPPPLLILLNIHSCYHYIQTKHVVAQIVNQKGVYVLIIYPQLYNKSTFYKEANYNVEPIFLTSY